MSVAGRTNWNNLAGKPQIYTKSEIDALGHVTDAALAQSHYTRAETDGLLLTKAPASHTHSQYVTDAALGVLLSDKVDWNSLGLTLNGYEQVDANLVRFVSATNDYVTLSYYSGGQTVTMELATRSKVDAMQQQITQNWLNFLSEHPP
jgi:hypothetical protein